MTPPTRFPARVHILLACDAPLGLVIRRGPSKRVCTILWDRRTDEFQLGQWLNGRIYERRSDLSPDGKHLIYFAMNGKWDDEAKGSWTAISRAPYLKAFTLLAKGDCWHGGGLFTRAGRYWLNEGYGHKVVRDSREVKRDTKYAPTTGFGGECPGVYYLRLIRDGWQLTGHEKLGKLRDQTVFEKPLTGDWTLRKIAHEQLGSPPGKGCYWDEHTLIREGQVIPCPGWEWADRDGERLVWSADGKLSAGVLGDDGLGETTELHDFNPMIYAPILAPY
jgi:hypothetical protein